MENFIEVEDLKGSDLCEGLIVIDENGREHRILGWGPNEVWVESMESNERSTIKF